MPLDEHDEAKIAHGEAFKMQQEGYIYWLKSHIVLFSYCRNFAELDQALEALHKKAGSLSDEAKLPRLVEALTFMTDRESLPRMDEEGMKRAKAEIIALTEQRQASHGINKDNKESFTWEEIENEMFNLVDPGDIDA